MSPMKNDTSVVNDYTTHAPSDNSEYYGILIVAAVFFSVFALAISVYLRRRRAHMAHSQRQRQPGAVATIANNTGAQNGGGRHRFIRGDGPGRSLRSLFSLDNVVRSGPPAYDDLPPSYEDAIKETTGVQNMAYASNPSLASSNEVPVLPTYADVLERAHCSMSVPPPGHPDIRISVIAGLFPVQMQTLSPHMPGTAVGARQTFGVHVESSIRDGASFSPQRNPVQNPVQQSSDVSASNNSTTENSTVRPTTVSADPRPLLPVVDNN